jgi:glycosyltransferase involved in cell wall biosynthesis
MRQYKICVYAICKNEEKFVDRWMDSMQEADAIVVTDTGSTDTTTQKLRDRGAIVYSEQIIPWRFDKARNLSLSHVPKDTDICVCTDLDEVFIPGWRNILESVWQPHTTIGKCLYNWSLKDDGTPIIQFNYCKIHTRNDYRWVCPVHECLKFCGSPPEQITFIDGLILNHYPDANKSRSSYLPLLELGVHEDPENDRMTYYLGREFMYKGMWDRCIETLKKHLTLKSATWKEERCASMRWIAKSYDNLGRMDEAYSWYYRAIAEVPIMRDPYVEFARLAYKQENWPLVFFLTEEALKIKSKSSVYVNMDYSWNHTPYDLGAIACYQLGMYERSFQHAKAALSYLPDDERLKSNLKFIEAKL